MDDHRRELGKLVLTGVLLAAIGASTYAIPAAADVRPWLRGEPIPIVDLFLDRAVVGEDEQGGVVEETVHSMDDIAWAPLDPSKDALLLPAREPAVPTALEIPEGALDAWFTALAEVEAAPKDVPGPIARALHWGDSTIAGDGIASSVRARLQERFGDGGPGFLAVHVDPRWALRPGVARWPKGEWETVTITFGGSEAARYGLAGTVSTATGEARTTLGGLEIDGERQLLHRFEVYYQRQVGGGGFSFSARGAGDYVGTGGSGTSDGFRVLETPDGAPYVTISTKGDGPVTIYGVALETKGPGVTWETLGVAGSSIASMMRQGRRHLAGQVTQRGPDLIVYMTGGNELGYESLVEADGALYKESYVKALQRLREGAPGASCLVLAPLDQARRERGKIVTKPELLRLVQIQHELALEQGCAFWDSWRAMGGDGGYARWMNHKPRYAWTDLMHLTDEGLDLIGQSLADAMLAEYDRWQKRSR